MSLRWVVSAVVVAAGVSPALAQTPPPRPVPFPGGATRPPASAPTETETQAPSDTALGAPLYPAAVFLETIDAGKGQQYHLYGVNAPYADIVIYYRTTLKNGGREIFEAPAMHQWELGRFQSQTMAYPPSIVVKDYTWNGSEGYPHVSGATVTRYRTIIQIVPPPGR